MAIATKKRVHYFGKTKSEGTKDMKELLGGKGANLAEMTSIGLPVPPGFTLTTETCAEYNNAKGKLPEGLMDEVHANMAIVEQETGKRFGSESDPLLVSVRSGAAVSMPGMMDTVLNLGISAGSARALCEATGDGAFATDTMTRFWRMFADIVLGISSPGDDLLQVTHVPRQTG